MVVGGYEFCKGFSPTWCGSSSSASAWALFLDGRKHHLTVVACLRCGRSGERSNSIDRISIVRDLLYLEEVIARLFMHCPFSCLSLYISCLF